MCTTLPSYVRALGILYYCIDLGPGFLFLPAHTPHFHGLLGEERAAAGQCCHVTTRAILADTIQMSPPYAFSVVTGLAAAMWADKLNKRGPFIVFQAAVAIAGLAMIVSIF